MSFENLKSRECRVDAFQCWLEAAEESALVACHWNSFSTTMVSRRDNLDPLLWLTDAAEVRLSAKSQCHACQLASAC